MARLVPLAELRSKSTSPINKLHFAEEFKSPRRPALMSPGSMTSRTVLSKTRKSESIKSKRVLPVLALSSKIESQNHMKLKFKSPRLLRKINLLENVGRPQTIPELSVSSTFTALNALKTLAEEDLINRSELMQIYRVLNKAILYPRSRVDSEVISEVMDRYTDIASEHEDVPYYCICEVLLSFLARKEAEITEHKHKNDEMLIELECSEEAHRKETEALQAVLDDLHTQLKPENSKLQAANQELMQCRINLETTFAKLALKETELKEARKSLNKENETFINLTRKLKDLKQQVTFLTLENSRIQSEHIEKQINYQHLGDNLHTAILKLKESQCTNASLNEELRLKDERVQELNVRAAVAFSDFTPRPSLSDFEAELGIVFKPKKSTAEKCQKILREIRNIKKRQQRLAKRMVEGSSFEVIPDV